MKYMIRETYTCQRGKVPEYVECLKVIIDAQKSGGFSFHKIMVDITDKLDTVCHEYEVDSVDKYFEWQRGFFANIDARHRQVVDKINECTVDGHREIFEVLM